jgi:tetratricopeptide (TPR) repeat protein
VRVIDFGLARPTGATTGGDDTIALSPTTPLRLTTVGALFGTPLYMAPEQHERRALDARVDQFAFCVALYEGLYGRPPFPTDSLPVLVHAVTTGKVIQPEPRPEIPARVVAALLKGLRADPDDRFPVIDALLDELQPPPRRRRGVVIASMALGAIAAAISTVIVLRVSDETQVRDPCEGGRARLAGVWDGDVKQRINGAFVASHRTHARETVERVDGLLDTYADAWVERRRHVCEATKLRHEQSDAAFDVRMDCLGKQLDELQALSGLFARADVSTVDNAVVAVRSLQPPQFCVQLAPGEAQPPTPAQRPVVEALARRLAEVRANMYAHNHEAAATKASAVLDVAKQLGYLPIDAEARYWLALAQSGASKPAEAERTLRDALDVAARAKEDVLIARMWTTLIYVVGHQLARTADALALEPVAKVAVQRADDEPTLLAELAYQVASVHLLKGDYKPAAERLEQAVKLRAQIGGEDQPEVAMMMNALGGAYLRTGNIFAAKTAFDKALAILDKSLGPSHPDTALTLANVGALSQAMGMFDEATKSHRRALALLEEVKGPDALDVGLTVYSLGVDMNGREDYKAAIPFYERALHIFEKVSPDHPYVGLSLVGLADCREEVGDAATAVPEAERGLALVEKQAGDPGQLALARYVLAKALWSANRDKPRALVLGADARKGFAAGGLALLNGRVAVDSWFKKIGQKPPD